MNHRTAVAASTVEVLHFEGEHPAPGIAAHDRGRAYGDGVFETMRAHAGAVPWWDAHWARLVAGAQRLGMAVPSSEHAREQASALLAGRDAVLKLLLARGAGGRGYAPAGGGKPAWSLSVHPLPAPFPAAITLRWCALRLAVQPALAGIKHCNRLEQVLARAEWSDTSIHEGLVCDLSGRLVSATAANVFLLQGQRWRTPDVGASGVAGVCRGWAIARLEASIEQIEPGEVEQADAVFVCNAVRGILPVARLGAREWSMHPQVAALQRRLAGEHPGFAMPAQASEST